MPVLCAETKYCCFSFFFFMLLFFLCCFEIAIRPELCLFLSLYFKSPKAGKMNFLHSWYQNGTYRNIHQNKINNGNCLPCGRREDWQCLHFSLMYLLSSLRGSSGVNPRSTSTQMRRDGTIM